MLVLRAEKLVMKVLPLNELLDEWSQRVPTSKMEFSDYLGLKKNPALPVLNLEFGGEWPNIVLITTTNEGEIKTRIDFDSVLPMKCIPDFAVSARDLVEFSQGPGDIKEGLILAGLKMTAKLLFTPIDDDEVKIRLTADPYFETYARCKMSDLA